MSGCVDMQMCGYADVRMCRYVKQGSHTEAPEAWWAGLYALSFDKLGMTTQLSSVRPHLD
jgi:hypothetical protein